jgi:hypothetical protein
MPHGTKSRPPAGVTMSDLNQKIFPCFSTNHLHPTDLAIREQDARRLKGPAAEVARSGIQLQAGAWAVIANVM